MLYSPIRLCLRLCVPCKLGCATEVISVQHNVWYSAEFGKVLDFRINRKTGTPQAGNNVGQKVVMSTLVA